MEVIPHTRQAWLRLVLLPFRTYVVAAPVCLFIWLAATKGQRVRGPRMEAALARTEAAFPIALGLFLCVGVFVVAALVQFWAYKHDRVLANLGFAAAALVILYFYVLPLCAS